jgi:hypothetical protein
VEVNKATGEENHISARESEQSHSHPEIGTLADRITVGNKAKQKKAMQKQHRKSKLLFDESKTTLPTIAKTTVPLAATNSKNRVKPKLPFSELKENIRNPLPRLTDEVTYATEEDIKNSDNVGVEAAVDTEQALRDSVHYTKLATSKLRFSSQKAAALKENAEGKAVEKLRFKSIKNNSKKTAELKKSNTNKTLQKRRLKRKYAKTFRGNATKQTHKKLAQTKRIATGIKSSLINAVKHGIGKKLALYIVIIGLLLTLLITGLSTCMSMFGGGFNTILLTSYTAEDEDILGADEDYFAMTEELAESIERIEDEHPNYDEYRYYLDVFGHDPFVLASYLTAKFNMYTREQVQAELRELFALQYELTLTPIIEIRTRTEIHTVIEIEIITEVDPEAGEEIEVEIETEVEVEVEIEYEYHILEIRLRNNSLDMVVIPRLTAEELEMFNVYVETQGNRPDLFENHPHAGRKEYLKYEIPPEALADERFAAIIAEAEKHLGRPYVWGGSSPATSFDCSGYVSWVLNQTGWNFGRLTVRGLFAQTTTIAPSEARPGDLIYFNYTYAAPQPHLPTHVGIYVGNNMMIHCGNPISYADITTPYWTKHFYAFGRLPEP